MKPSKLQSVILYVLSNIGRDLGAIELAKIVYLIDVESMSFFLETITGETYLRNNNGPLAENFLREKAAMEGLEIKITIEPSGSSGIPKHNHRIGDNPRFEPELDAKEIAVIKRILSKIEGLSPIQIEQIAYRTKPMQALCKKEFIEKLIGEKVDLTLVEKNKIMEQWRENQNIKKQEDPLYDEFLAQERAEVDELIASWG